MENFESLSHVRWECKYHIVFIPKYRRKVIVWQTAMRGIGTDSSGAVRAEREWRCWKVMPCLTTFTSA